MPKIRASDHADFHENRLKWFRPYRALRVAYSYVRVLVRYLVLLARDRLFARRSDAAAWNRAHEFAAEEIRRVAIALQGAFVKGAQIGGARADILPAPFIDKLSQFHDAVPPRDFESLRPLIARDLGCPIEDVFASIEERALAAASLAQVHRATLRDGREVVIKIQYPEIRRIIPLDLALLRRVVGLVHVLQRRVDLRGPVAEVTRFIELELDFPREARSTERLGKILESHPGVRVPQIVPEYCGANILVLEFLDGIQVSKTGELKRAGHKLADVAKRIGDLYGAMIFRYGYFHGDPHPGNLLVLPDGAIGLLDFGLCKELPPGFARDIAELMVAAIVGDAPATTTAADKLGFDTTAIRPEHLRSLMLSMIGDSDTDDSLLDIMSQSRLRRIPEDLALVIRTLILLNGLSHRLAPRRRLIQAQLIQHLAAEV
jgi:ubiquinone biosynthesis protein